MSQVMGEDQQRLVEEPEFNVRPCSEPDCMNEALYRCEVRILCKKQGCGQVICEEHKSKNKLCFCFDQKEMIVCKKCAPELKEKARKRHFWAPALLFMVINLIVWMILIIGRIDEMQEV